MKGRIFKPDTFTHVYARALNGNIVFYSQDDCLYYLSLFLFIIKENEVLKALTIITLAATGDVPSRVIEAFLAA